MTCRQIRAGAAAGVLAGALAVQGCGSADEGATSPATTASKAAATTPAPAALPDGMAGTWRRTMRARDWGDAGGFPTGTWRLRVHPGGAVDVYVPHGTTVDFSTSFAVKGATLTVSGVPVCPGVTGRYRWRLAGGALRLNAARDPECGPRAALFGGTWTRAR